MITSLFLLRLLCVTGEKFHSLPTRKKKKPSETIKRRNSDEFENTTPPKKPPRIFVNAYQKPPAPPRHNSIFNIFKRNEQEHQPKKSNLRRSVSDATNLKSKTYHEKTNRKRNGSDTEDVTQHKTKKNLSPIIETNPRDDYFANYEEENKENVEEPAPSNITQQLKEYIDEIDEELFKETGLRPKDHKKKPPGIVIIDVDKAEKISDKKERTNKFLGRKFKFLGGKDKAQNAIKKTDSLETPQIEMIHSSQKPAEKPPLTKGRTVDRMVKRLSYDNSSPPPKSNVMIVPNVNVQHNNNQPFSYTRGLSPEDERNSRNAVNSPVIYAQVVCEQNGGGGKQTIHTAYTNGKKHLPHSDSDEGLGYEENVTRKFGTEKNVIRFGDDFFNEDEYPITPKFKNVDYNGFRSYDDYTKTEHNIFIDSSSRGRGDGMDSKRRESLTETFDNLNITPKQHYPTNVRSDLSARRDQLESRLNRRFGGEKSPEYRDKSNVRETLTTKYYRSGSASPVSYREKHVTEKRYEKDGKQYTTESHSRKYFGDENDYRKHYRYIEHEPKSFDSQLSDYRSSPENIRNFEPSQDYRRSPYNNNKYKTKTPFKNKDHHKSNPEINQIKRDYKYESGVYHDSLKRDTNKQRYYDQHEERKDKFGDSGIENDFRRDSGENFLTNRQNPQEFSNESEDEGFASSLLIASERQHTEDNFANKKQKKEYDYEKSYHKDVEYYRNVDNTDYKKYKTKDRNEYAPRERSIDDGSHFDPRIDKDFDKGTLKRVTDKKPPKPEKKSSLEKVGIL